MVKAEDEATQATIDALNASIEQLAKVAASEKRGPVLRPLPIRKRRRKATRDARRRNR
jgi:hypothetical protein